MQLSELKSRISSQADYAPTNTPGWDQYLTNILNDAYTKLWYERPWTFNTKTIDLMVYPDLSGTQALQLFTGQTNTTTYPLKTSVTQCSFTLAITGANPVFYIQVSPAEIENLIGASLEVEGRDYTIVDIYINDTGSDYEITFYVDYPYYGDHDTGGEVSITSWSIKFKEYKLPSDVNEIMDVSWRNNRDVGALRAGQAIGLAERSASDHNINWQLSSTKPSHYINKSYSYMYDTVDPLTVTQTTGLGTPYPVGTYYFAWERYDLVTGATSGILDAQTVSITASNVISLNWTDYRALPVGQARRLLLGVKRSANSVVKWVYLFDNYTGTVNQWLEPSKGTIWRYGSTSKSLSADSYISLTSTGASPRDGYRGGSNSIQLNYNGNIDRKNILFFPRLGQADFSTNATTGRILEHSSVATIRYLYKCMPLADDYDSPQLPAEYHNLLVFKALETISLKHGKLTEAAYYTRMSDDLLKGMLSRYGDQRNVKLVKGGSMSIGHSAQMLFKVNWLG